jgi:hypothetical protein
MKDGDDVAEAEGSKQVFSEHGAMSLSQLGRVHYYCWKEHLLEQLLLILNIFFNTVILA